MDTPEKRKQLKALAEEVFALSQLGSQVRAQARTGDAVEVLTETETLTLDLLSKQEVMSVGEIQRAVGVLPAQMSRIVRALEDKAGTAYIKCAINPQDRRKIDVSITPEGSKALEAYRTARTSMTVRFLSVLTLAERDEFMRILRKLQDHMSKTVIRS